MWILRPLYSCGALPMVELLSQYMYALSTRPMSIHVSRCSNLKQLSQISDFTFASTNCSQLSNLESPLLSQSFHKIFVIIADHRHRVLALSLSRGRGLKFKSMLPPLQFKVDPPKPYASLYPSSIRSLRKLNGHGICIIDISSAYWTYRTSPGSRSKTILALNRAHDIQCRRWSYCRSGFQI